MKIYTGASDTVTAIDTITGNSFDFSARQFDGTGSVVVNTPKPNSASTHDFEFFLAKMASLFLTTNEVSFQIVEEHRQKNLDHPKILTMR